MASITPIEEYMQELVQQHRLKKDIADSDFESALEQSKAAAAQDLSLVDQQPFEIAARQYNLDAREWVGKEKEARDKIKATISAHYLHQQAKTAAARQQAKKALAVDTLSTLERLQNVNQKGLRAFDQIAPKIAGLRADLVFDPTTGTVTQRAKPIVNENTVRAQELADYLQLPVDVVQRQWTQERLQANDALWKQFRRGLTLEKDRRAEERAEKAEERAARSAERAELSFARELDAAQFARGMRMYDAAEKLMKYPKGMVDSLINNADTHPEMQIAASLGDALRQGADRARAEKDAKKQEEVVRTTAMTILKNNAKFMTALAEGRISETEIDFVTQQAARLVTKMGYKPQTFDRNEFLQDFGFEELDPRDKTLRELEAFRYRRQGLP